jgi:hypothetical protein
MELFIITHILGKVLIWLPWPYSFCVILGLSKDLPTSPDWNARVERANTSNLMVLFTRSAVQARREAFVVQFISASPMRNRTLWYNRRYEVTINQIGYLEVLLVVLP